MLMVHGEILSGPAAFLIFSFVKRIFTSHGWTVKGGGGRPESQSEGTALVVFFLSNLL